MTNNEYLINLEKRKAYKNNLECAIFSQVLGIMLIISSFFWYLDAKNHLNEYFSFFSIALGNLFIILGVIVPSIFEQQFNLKYLIVIIVLFYTASNGANSIIVASNQIYGIKK